MVSIATNSVINVTIFNYLGAVAHTYNAKY